MKRQIIDISDFLKFLDDMKITYINSNVLNGTDSNYYPECDLLLDNNIITKYTKSLIVMNLHEFSNFNNIDYDSIKDFMFFLDVKSSLPQDIKLLKYIKIYLREKKLKRIVGEE